ncbi:MAG: hypothetical protein PVJ76_02340 [Gemmatimonadota bacterium]
MSSPPLSLRDRRAVKGFGRRGRFSPALLVLLFCAFRPQGVSAQEETNLQVAELRHTEAQDLYDAARAALEAYETEYTQALQAFDQARTSENEEAALEAYARVTQVAGLRGVAQRRLEERAEELREARRVLLEANRIYWQGLIDRAGVATDSTELEALYVQIEGTIAEMGRLRALPEPEITLEPLPEINIEPRDGPNELRLKAGRLEFAASRYEEQQAYFTQQLEDLRRDQRLYQISRDFLADRERFGDRPPVGAAGARNVLPPEQLEQQIQELELIQEELVQRIQSIRTRAADFRRRAGGGEWA